MVSGTADGVGGDLCSRGGSAVTELIVALLWIVVFSCGAYLLGDFSP